MYTIFFQAPKPQLCEKIANNINFLFVSAGIVFVVIIYAGHGCTMQRDSVADTYFIYANQCIAKRPDQRTLGLQCPKCAERMFFRRKVPKNCGSFSANFVQKNADFLVKTFFNKKTRVFAFQLQITVFSQCAFARLPISALCASAKGTKSGAYSVLISLDKVNNIQTQIEGHNRVAIPKIDGNDQLQKILKNTPPMNNPLLQDEIMVLTHISY